MNAVIRELRDRHNTVARRRAQVLAERLIPVLATRTRPRNIIIFNNNNSNIDPINYNTLPNLANDPKISRNSRRTRRATKKRKQRKKRAPPPPKITNVHRSMKSLNDPAHNSSNNEPK